MSEQLAPTEPYTTSFEATVAHRDGRDLVLDSTYFYAESGGQPADRGTLAGQTVEDVQSVDGDVIHTLAAEPEVEAGETVTGVVDDAFRTYCMRAHTASHVLYGAGRRVLSDLGYGGFDIGTEKVRVDFRTSTDIDDDVLLELERLVNRAIWNSLPVSWEVIPKDEAQSRDGIAFNTATEEGVLSDSDTVRVVEIGGEGEKDSTAEPWDASEQSSTSPKAKPWDVAACGGTHVRNTGEIGPVTVLDRSNPGEGLTRVEFAVGPTAIERRTTERRAALDAAHALGTNVSDLPDELTRLQDENAALMDELDDLKGQIADARLAELRDEVVEKDGRQWLVGSVDGFGANELDDRVRGLAGDAADVVVLTGTDGGTFVVAGAGDGLDAGDVVDAVTDEFGGGGGGSPTFAQGGGLDAAPEDVVTFLRE